MSPRRLQCTLLSETFLECPWDLTEPTQWGILEVIWQNRTLLGGLESCRPISFYRASVATGPRLIHGDVSWPEVPSLTPGADVPLVGEAVPLSGWTPLYPGGRWSCPFQALFFPVLRLVRALMIVRLTIVQLLFYHEKRSRRRGSQIASYSNGGFGWSKR